jgi:ribose-phosphate pyrophosphokinase
MISINGAQPIEQRKFPDGTYNMTNVPDENDVFSKFGLYFRWIYESNEEMIFLYMLSKHYRSKGHKVQYLEMPYVPNARMDRTHSDNEVFTLKYFCEFINDLNFEKVIIHDPHSNVAPALLNNCCVTTPEKDINKLMQDLVGEKLVSHILYPDEGAMKRYSSKLSYPYLVGMKTRDWKSGKITGLKIINDSTESVTGVLIVDDICSYGGTFVAAGKALAQMGCLTNFLYVTHCEQSILKGSLIDDINIKVVYVGCPSMYDGSHPKIKYLKK